MGLWAWDLGAEGFGVQCFGVKGASRTPARSMCFELLCFEKPGGKARQREVLLAVRNLNFLPGFVGLAGRFASFGVACASSWGGHVLASSEPLQHASPNPRFSSSRKPATCTPKVAWPGRNRRAPWPFLEPRA